jgi:hypothetical protein
MGTKTKSFLSAVALGFGLLFFGPATSDAQAQHAGPYVEFRGQFPLPHGSIDVYANNAGHHGKRYGRHYRNRSYSRHQSRPYYGRSYYRHHRPYRLVRVFVYDPYPRFVYRRVYYSQRIAGDYCRPY